jgi:hypothetical protein
MIVRCHGWLLASERFCSKTDGPVSSISLSSLSLYIWDFMETKLSFNIPNKGCRYFSLFFCGVVLFSWRGFLIFPLMLMSLALLSNLPYEGPTHLIFSYYLPSCFFISLFFYLLCSLSFFIYILKLRK